MTISSSDPVFFETPVAWRRWLTRHHATERELWVGFHKTSTGTPSITWPESVDEALCVGWIDGLRRGIDAARYMIRFTPRKATSIWSLVNVGRVAELTRLGRMGPAGLAAFAKRREDKTGIYGHDRANPAVLEPAWHTRFKANKQAWRWFETQAPSYQRVAIHWIMSAKREETRLRRFEQLLLDSSEERRLANLTSPTRAGAKKTAGAKKSAVAKGAKKSAVAKGAKKHAGVKKTAGAKKRAGTKKRAGAC